MATPIYFATQYTSVEEVTYILSELGVELRNDDAPSDPDIMFWCNRATGRVQGYFERRWNMDEFGAALAANSWVRDLATSFAAYYFAGRGGECVNETLKTGFEEAVALLEAIQEKAADIPGFSPDNEKGTIPTVSQSVVDMLYNPPMRVNAAGSTGHPAGYNQRRFYPGDWTGPN